MVSYNHLSIPFMQNPSSLPYTCQVYDAINGIALSLSDLITRKSITYQTKQKVIRLKLFQRLKSYTDLATGYQSASGTKSIYFDENQDGPPVFDILNLVVCITHEFCVFLVQYIDAETGDIGRQVALFFII